MKVHLVSITSSPGVNRFVDEYTERLARVADVRTTRIEYDKANKKVHGFLRLLLQKHRVKKVAGELLHVLTPVPFTVEDCDLMTVYDIFGFHYLHLWADNLRNTVAKWLEYKSIRTALRVHATSEATKQDLVTYCGRPSASIFVVPLGIDMEKFNILEGAEKFSNTVLYVGDDHPRKNLKRLVQALALIKPSPTLLWVGGELYSQERQDVRAMAAIYGVPLAETGRVTDAELAIFYNKATIYVHPSLNAEGFGLPPIEAQACGTLVAVSDIPPFDETLGYLAIRFDPEDPADMAHGIKLALASAPKSLPERQLLRDEVKRFDWDYTVAQLLEVYREVQHA